MSKDNVSKNQEGGYAVKGHLVGGMGLVFWRKKTGRGVFGGKKKGEGCWAKGGKKPGNHFSVGQLGPTRSQDPGCGGGAALRFFEKRGGGGITWTGGKKKKVGES